MTEAAVVTDLDGTIVRADGTISEATVSACHALRRQGIPVIAAVGRAVAMADSPREVLDAATRVTETVEEDGFSRALTRLGFI